MTSPTPTVPGADLLAEVYEFIADSASESEPLARQCPGFIVALRSEAERLRSSPPRGGDGAGEMADEPITIPAALHDDTRRLVVVFAEAMARKLRKAEIKYGYTNGWLTDDWEDDCRRQLYEHLAKGDPMDVAIYCAFMLDRNWPLTRRAQPIPGAGEGRDKWPICEKCGEIIREDQFIAHYQYDGPAKAFHTACISASPPPATGEVGAVNAYWRGELDRTDKQHIEALATTRREVDLWVKKATDAEAALASANADRFQLSEQLITLTTSLDQARAVVEAARVSICKTTTHKTAPRNTRRRASMRASR